MKKLLLLSAVCLAASMACTSVSAKAPLRTRTALKADRQVVPGAFKSVKDMVNARQAFYASKKLSGKKFLQAPRKAEDDMLKMNYTYSMYAYVYSEVLGTTLLQGMYGQALYGFSDDVLYLSPFGGEASTVAGKADPSIQDEMTEEGGVAYVFDLSTVKIEDEDGTFVMRKGYYDDDQNLFRDEDTKLVGYYFADAHELYIPDFIGMWNETPGEEDAPVIGAEELDLIPAEDFADGIYNGTFAAKTYTGDNLAGDVQALVATSVICVKGFAPLNEDSWVIFIPNYEGETATLPAYQLLSEGSYWVDEEHTAFFTECDITLGIKVSAEGRISYPNEDMSSSYFLESDDDFETMLIENDKKANFAIYAFADNDDYEGFWGGGILTDLSINVSDQLAGVKDVKASDKKAYTEYFDMQGRKVSAAHKGFTVRKQHQADGSVTAKKLILK